MRPALLRHALLLAASLAVAPALAQGQQMTLQPPVAEQRPHQFERHGIRVDDPYAWLRDDSYPTVDDPDVLAYLNAENAYFEQAMAPRQALVDTLFAEMRGRIKEADASVPQKDGDFLYWSSFDEGAQYRRHWRHPVAGGADQLILDGPALAEGKEYFRLGAMDVSPSGRYLAYAVDDNGSERFTIRIRDLQTGEMLPDTIPGTLGGIVWAEDDRSLLYGLANANWRVDNARVHLLGTPAEQDVEIYREADNRYNVGVGMTQSRRFIILSVGNHDTSELRLIPADNPRATPILVSARSPGREYDLEEHDGTLLIHTNDTGPNWRLAAATLDNPGEWRELIATSPDFYMTGLSAFRDFFVVEGRERGLDQIAIHRYDRPTDGRRIAFPETSYSASLGSNPEWAVDRLRLDYESMVTPSTDADYDVATGQQTILKVEEIPSGYDPARYRTTRLTITARDGAQVPVSVVHRADFPVDGSRPLHLYAYGAYGYATPPGFSTERLSLLDRGFAYAIAHIRGGDDLGQQWHHDGRLAKRTNTFNDFVDVARGLVERGYTSAGRISASGGSAGGELMGAIVNSDPELFGAIVAHVPFVDVLNTMLDDSLPLTPGEWGEWGNPITSADDFRLLQSYSPYDNVTAQAYPPMLVTAGLNDPRVTYWEPAKWVARLRDRKTDDNILLLKTNMGAGHGGKSGRFESLREDAEEQAFILWQLGMTE